jgi:hypothetical protein
LDKTCPEEAVFGVSDHFVEKLLFKPSEKAVAEPASREELTAHGPGDDWRRLFGVVPTGGGIGGLPRPRSGKLIMERIVPGSLIFSLFFLVVRLVGL